MSLFNNINKDEKENHQLVTFFRKQF